MSAPVARIVVQSPDRAAAYVPYDFRHIPGSIPGRRWDRDRKAWLVSTSMLDVLADALREAGVTVYLHRGDGTEWRSGKHGRRSAPAADWVSEAFHSVADELVPVLRRSLLAAFHPDRGGDPELAKRVNAVADARLNGRRRP